MAKTRQSALSENLVERLSPDTQILITRRMVEGYTRDVRSRIDWSGKRNDWYKLAQMVPTRKNKPWPGAANVCVPMVASAVLQFASRAYAALFDQPSFERLRTLPVEATDEISARRVQDFMTWQLAMDIEDYEAKWDKALHELGIMGTIFQKIGYDEENERPIVEFPSSLDVIVPYGTETLRRARRVTQRHRFHIDEIMDDGQDGFYVNTEDLQQRSSHDEDDDNDAMISSEELQGESDEFEEEQPNIVLETHFKAAIEGIDEPGSPRPYILWLDKGNMKPLRLVHRTVSVEGKKVDMNMWVDYHLIPNPAGFYSYGYGHYLEALNRISNTIFNQYIDAGRMANQLPVFYGRGAGIKGRAPTLTPGVGIQVNDVQQVLMAKFPGLSGELAQLLTIAERYNQDLTSKTEEMSGRAAKGVREPTVGGTVARIEQGLISFGVIVKRIARQQSGGEFRLIHTLNKLFLPKEKAFRVLGRTDIDVYAKVSRADFDGRMDIIATADPAFSVPQQRRAEALQMMEISNNSPIIVGNPELGIPPNIPLMQAIAKSYFRTFGVTEANQYIPEPPPAKLHPAVENQMFREGRDTAPRQGEKHAEHLAAHMQEIEETGGNTLLEAHIEQTQRIYEAELEAENVELDRQTKEQQGALNGTGNGSNGAGGSPDPNAGPPNAGATTGVA